MTERKRRETIAKLKQITVQRGATEGEQHSAEAAIVRLSAVTVEPDQNSDQPSSHLFGLSFGQQNAEWLGAMHQQMARQAMSTAGLSGLGQADVTWLWSMLGGLGGVRR